MKTINHEQKLEDVVSLIKKVQNLKNCYSNPKIKKSFFKKTKRCDPYWRDNITRLEKDIADSYSILINFPNFNTYIKSILKDSFSKFYSSDIIKEMEITPYSEFFKLIQEQNFKTNHYCNSKKIDEII